jgi:S-formylglutathione hydrolase FrmB
MTKYLIMLSLTALIFCSAHLAHADGIDTELCKTLHASFNVASAKSRVINSEFKSKITGKRMPFHITLPAGFPCEKPLPVAIFLHGRGGGQTADGQFNAFGGAELMDLYRKNGGAPLVVVAADEPADSHSYWRNGTKQHLMQTESMVISELMVGLRFCLKDKLEMARIKPAITGISMGGNGSFYYGMKYPSQFSQGYFISPIFRGQDRLAPEDKPVFGIGADFAQQDALTRFQTLPEKKNECSYPLSRWRAEIAADDELRDKSVTDTDLALKTIAANCRGHVETERCTGGHSEKFWRGALYRSLNFIGEGFVKEGAPAKCRVDEHVASKQPSTSTCDVPDVSFF